jgi:hypothetical protein
MHQYHPIVSLRRHIENGLWVQQLTLILIVRTKNMVLPQRRKISGCWIKRNFSNDWEPRITRKTNQPN